MKERHYLPAADLFRVLCIALIAWYHFWQLSWLDPGFDLGGVHIDLQQTVRNGYMLVDMLLVLSGFLLALPYARWAQGRGDKPDGVDFYKKRFIRIVPSYLFAVLLSFFAWAIPTGQYADAPAAVRDLLAHLSFTHNLFRETLYFTKLQGVLWTLAVEVQFYLIFPLLGLCYVRKPFYTCGLMTLAALIFRTLAMKYGDLSYLTNQLPLLLDVYAAGMAAAWLLAKLETRELSCRWVFPLLALMTFACILQLMYGQVIGPDGNSIKRMQLLWRLPMALCGAAFLLFGSLAPRRVLRAVGNPVTRFLSGISYNFYIWHQFLARRMVDWNLPRHLAELPNQVYEQPWQSRYSALVWLAALAAAVLCTYGIEKPCARYLKKRL